MAAKTIVIDFGSKFVRCGFSGEICPRFIFENKLNAFFTNDGGNKEELLRQTFDFFHLCFSALHVKPKEYRVLLIENLFLKKLARDILITVLLRDLQVVA
jgi:actin-related protein